MFLYGGVGTLSFNSIDAQIDTSVNPAPYQVVIGTPNTPLKQQPSIYLNNITNLVFDSTSTTIPTTPLTTPSVEFTINGVVRNFDIVSATQGAVPAGFQFEFPQVGTTGRTAVQATAINTLNVHGSAKNFTVSRAPVPFSSEASGVGYLKKATFGGNADAVGLDVHGKIGKLTFKRGLGNPAGVFTAKSPSTGLLLPTTTVRNASGHDRVSRRRSLRRHDPGQEHRQAHGQAGQRVRRDRRRIRISSSSAFKGIRPTRSRPGYSLTNAVITTSGSIGNVSVQGTELNSEVKTGLRLHRVRRGPRRDAGASQIGQLAPARRPGEQRQLGELPPRQQSLQPRQPARPVRARSPPRSSAHDSTPAARPAWATPAPDSSPATSNGCGSRS